MRDILLSDNLMSTANNALKLTAVRCERVVDLVSLHESSMSRAGGVGGSLAMRSRAFRITTRVPV